MKTVTVQNTPCIRQDSESELKKVRMSRNEDIAIFLSNAEIKLWLWIQNFTQKNLEVENPCYIL